MENPRLWCRKHNDIPQFLPSSIGDRQLLQIAWYDGPPALFPLVLEQNTQGVYLLHLYQEMWCLSKNNSTLCAREISQLTIHLLIHSCNKDHCMGFRQ